MSFSELFADFQENSYIYQEFREISPSKTLINLFEYFTWDNDEFHEQTKLEKTYFERAKNENYRFDIKTVVTICVAMELDLSMTEFILEGYGHKLVANKELHALYKFLIVNVKQIEISYSKELGIDYYVGVKIDACNYFLKHHNVPQHHMLGSVPRKPNKKKIK